MGRGVAREQTRREGEGPAIMRRGALMGVAVGIDLGTTNTVVGAVRAGNAVTLADETGSRLTPSIVSFHPSGKVIVGEPAKERRIVDPTNTIYSVKRLIGR